MKDKRIIIKAKKIEKQKIKEGGIQKGGNNGIPVNPPSQNLRPIEPPPQGYKHFPDGKKKEGENI